MIHKLKIKYRFYEQIKSLEKTFEIRFNDRQYKKWDKIHFSLVDELKNPMMIKSDIVLEITNVFDSEWFWLEKGYCILSFKIILPWTQQESK